MQLRQVLRSLSGRRYPQKEIENEGDLPVGRRQMLRAAIAMGASAVGAGALLHKSAPSAQAADGGNFILGQINTATSTTELDRSGASMVPGWRVRNTSDSTYAGSFIESGNNAAGLGGFVGLTGGSGGFGVVGQASNSGTGTYGSSGTGDGVYGTTGGANTPGGVHGFSSGANGNGVIGEADNGSFAAGVWGISTSGFAGYFQGNVFVTGSITIQGAKSAAVPASDGSLRRLYSLESPESWFEDFGTGTLARGAATISLAPDFAGVIDTTGYHVFLTPLGETDGLYVSNQTATSFEVHEAHGRGSNVSFSYRVAAKRKDIAGVRLETVPLPPVRQPITLPTNPPAAPVGGP